MEINIISKQSSMKRGCFCDIVNVNKEQQRQQIPFKSTNSI